jgi:hypothetical protein
LRILILSLLTAISCRTGSAETFDSLRDQGFVVVSAGGPDDGGDFGPKTPGTKTAGIQEALNHLRTTNFQQHRAQNLYIANGQYDTTETIHVLWLGERFRIEASESWINYMPATGDALVIDSQMNARLRFGYVSGLQLTDGWVVKVKPVHPGPARPCLKNANRR